MSYYDAPQTAPPDKNGTSVVLIVVAILGVLLVVAVLCIGILAALLLPAVQAAREAARSMSSMNNMKQIGLAMHNYSSVYGTFPPRVTYDADGQPLYSWRVLLLPYIEQQALYGQLDLDQAWDSPANAQFTNMAIAVYLSPSDTSLPNSTSYFAVDDPQSVMNDNGVAFSEITDGTANTLLIFESTGKSIPWAAPEDLTSDDFADALMAGISARGTLIGTADGAVMAVPKGTSAETAKALVTRDGNETVPPF